MNNCDAACWTRVDCKTCGKPKAPRGRSVAMPAANGYCDLECPGYTEEPTAPHLWSEHDDARHYTDPDGWAAHVASCDKCRPETTEDA